MAFGQVAGSSSFGALCGTLLPKVGLGLTALLCAAAVAALFVFVAIVRERPGERLLPWTPGESSKRTEVTVSGITDNFRDLFRVLVLPMSLLLVVVSFAYFLRGGLVTPVFAAFAVQDLGLSTAEYGGFVGALTIAVAVACVVLGPWIDRLGARRFLMGALVLGALAHLVAGLLAERTNDLVVFGSVAVVIYLVGQVVFITIIALFMNLCWTKVAATQFAVYMALANVGIVSGGMLFVPFADDLTFAQDFLIMAGLFVVAALGLMFFRERAHDRQLEALRARAS